MRKQQEDLDSLVNSIAASGNQLPAPGRVENWPTGKPG